MSLINDALKKAQRQRTEGPASDAPPIPGGAPVAKRAEPRSANTVVLIASGALVLVVLSVVATVLLVNRPKPQPVVAKAATPTANANKTAATTEGAAPALIPPNLTPPAPKPASETVAESTAPAVIPPTPPPSKPEVKESSKADRVTETKTTPPSVASKSPATKTASPTPTATASSPAHTSAPSTVSAPNAANSSSAANVPTPSTQGDASTAAAAPTPAKPDERIVAFVENVKVAGIRSSGNESRVLMNDRVFRVNDIVERTLGVRLVKVAVDSLTFADSNGVTYVKYF